MIEILSMTLQAGVAQTFHINGEYVEVLDAQYPLDVQMISREGVPLSIMRNAEASFFSRPGKFGSLLMQSANAQVVRVFIGSGDAGTRRISSTVQVVDGGKARTIANAAFMGSVYGGVVAGQYAENQLWNPVGSGVRLVLKSFSVSSGTASNVKAGFVAAALSTLNASGMSKLSGGAVGVGKTYKQNSAVDLVGASQVDLVAMQANSTFVRMLQEPIVINPGYGLVIMPTIQASDFLTTFEWVEESV